MAATDNHIAQLLFMLSHYVADAHMPLHCDSRRFSDEADIHGHIEGDWEHAFEEHYPIDRLNQRFLFDPKEYPLREPNPADPYAGSVLARVADELDGRPFRIGWGGDNSNVWDFMTAVCQHSCRMADALIPQSNTPATVTTANLDTLNPAVPLDTWSVAALADAVDSISRVWFRIWRRCLAWEAVA